jgi:serine protease Do
MERHPMRGLSIALFAILVSGILVAEQPPKPVKPFEVDDEQLLQVFTEKLAKLVEDEKCLAPDSLREQVKVNRQTKIKPLSPGEKRLDPEDVYESALDSVFIVGSVVDDEIDFQSGRMATAWVLAENGILVTNYHVFQEIENGEYFGAMDRNENVYPVTKILAVNQEADLCVFQIEAKKLKPLPVATSPVRVGAWIGVLGHPGDHYFTFTQGTVTRYSKQHREDGKQERWMGITADFAIGASGSPVLDRRGAVVGIAALTKAIDALDEKPAENAPPMPMGSPLQMVVKEAVPISELLKLIGEKK